MGFKNSGPGCCGCNPCPGGYIYRVDVRGCNGTVLPGATVTVTGVGSVVTDATGRADVTLPGPGTYSGTVTKSRFTSVVLGSFTVATGACLTTRTVNMGGGLAAGYVCCPHCVDPVADTLYVTDGNGTHTLLWDGFTTWAGSYVQSGVSPTVACTGSPCNAFADITPEVSRTGSVLVFLGVTCPASAGASFILGYSARGYNLGGHTPGYMPVYADTSCNPCDSTLIASPASITGGSGCGVPLALSYSVSSSWLFPPPSAAGRTGPASGTVTVSE